MAVFTEARRLFSGSTLGFQSIGDPINGNTLVLLCNCLPYSSGTYQWTVKTDPALDDSSSIAADNGNLAGDSLTINIPITSGFTVGTKYYFALKIDNGTTPIEIIQVSFEVAQNGVDSAGTSIIQFFTSQFTQSGEPITTTNKIIDLDGIGLLQLKKSKTVSSLYTADFTTDGTDDQVQIQEAVDSLTAGRTWVEKISLIGDFVVSGQVLVPPYTEIEIIGTITVTAGWKPTVDEGVFRVGTDGQASESIEIYGGKYIGNTFSSYPTRNAGVSERHCCICSKAVLQNCSFHDYSFENFGSPFRANDLGAISGTPSQNVMVWNVSGRECIVGIELYCNGFEYKNCHVWNISIDDALDDSVAIVANWGGIPGAGAIVSDCSVKNVSGRSSSDGSRGGTIARVKLDAGDTGTGKGVLKNIEVNGVQSTATTTTSGGLVSLFNGGNPETNNIQISNLQSKGDMAFMVYLQTSGRGLAITNFFDSSKYGIILQSSSSLSDNQMIKVNSGLLAARGATVEGSGLTFCAGSAGQGFRNIKVVDVDILKKDKPVNEEVDPLDTDFTNLVGSVVDATLNNVQYTIDTRDRALSDCVFISTNRRVVHSRNGEYLGVF